MPEGLLSAIHLVLQTREVRIAGSNATYPKARRAAINSTIRRHGRNWHIAPFRCDVEFGCYSGKADFSNRTPGRFMSSQPGYGDNFESDRRKAAPPIF